MNVEMVELPKNEKCAACGVRCVGAHWHYGSTRLRYPAGRDGRVRFCTGACCPLIICQEIVAARVSDEEVEWDESPSKDEDELVWEDVQG